MNTKFLIAVISLFVCFVMFSCKKEKVICEHITHEALQGKWHHKYKVYTDEDDIIFFATPPKFSFEFEADSFFMSINQSTDMIDTSGCVSDWTEYAKGSYLIDDAKLILDGVYCESDFSVKTEGCYNIGVYTDTFISVLCDEKLRMFWVRVKGSSEIIMIKD